jgi:hypothetical protein
MNGPIILGRESHLRYPVKASDCRALEIVISYRLGDNFLEVQNGAGFEVDNDKLARERSQ